MNISGADKMTLQALDLWFDYRSRNQNKPGLQIVVRRGGGLIFNKAYGLANRETNEAMTTEHFFAVASQSKMLTSCALHLLQARGRLHLADAASDYLPELGRHWDKRAKGITLRDLLTHRSGFVCDGQDASFWNLESPMPSQKEVLRQASLADIVFEPNTVTKYSNFAFSLLGSVIERTSGLPYNDIIERQVIAPLCNEGLMPDYRDDFQTMAPLFAQGYSRPLSNGRSFALPPVRNDGFAPALGAQATALGMSYFAYHFLNGNKLIAPEAQKEIKATFWPFANMTDRQYGLGVDKSNDSGVTLLGHKGAHLGFSTSTQCLVGTDYVVSVNQNTMGAEDVLVQSAVLMNRINETFDKKGLLAQTQLSQPLMDLWGAYVYLVGPNCVLGLPLDSAKIGTEAVVFERRGSDYIATQTNGIGAVGEKIAFTKDRAGKITACESGGCVLLPEAKFKQHLRDVLRTQSRRAAPACE